MLKRNFHEKQCGGYRIIKKLNEGAFGQVFVAAKGDQKFALKVTLQKQYILNEISQYKKLAGEEYSGLPLIGEHGACKDFVFFGMELLGPDLQVLSRKHKRLSLKSVLMLGEQGISRLKFLHSRGIIHRDIKPQNFCVGSVQKNETHRIYLIDLGLSRTLDKPDKGGIIGTPCFMSARAHSGSPQTQRDDLQSFFYCLIYLLKGELPWMGMPGNNRTELQRMGVFKQKFSRWGKYELPKQLMQCMQQLKNQGDQPDYEWYRNKLRGLMKSKKYQYDYIFEWNCKKQSTEPKEVKPVLEPATEPHILQSCVYEAEKQAVLGFIEDYSEAKQPSEQSRITLEPPLGKGEFKQPRKKLPDPREFYLKPKKTEQSRPTTGPRIAFNREPYQKPR